MENYVDTNATVNAGSGLTKDASTSGADTIDLGGEITKAITTLYRTNPANAAAGTTTLEIKDRTSGSIDDVSFSKNSVPLSGPPRTISFQ